MYNSVQSWVDVCDNNPLMHPLHCTMLYYDIVIFIIQATGGYPSIGYFERWPMFRGPQCPHISTLELSLHHRSVTLPPFSQEKLSIEFIFFPRGYLFSYSLIFSLIHF